MTDDLTARLLDLAHSKHDDLSVAAEAADEIERLRAEIHDSNSMVLYQMAARGRNHFQKKYYETRTALIKARNHLRSNRASWNGPQFQAVWTINKALGVDPPADKPGNDND